jgi:hypothetical protein
MGLGTRISALWAQWQVVVYMGAVIVLLAGLNVWQWKCAIEAPLKIRIDSQDKALDNSAALQASDRVRITGLLKAADSAAATLNASSDDYRRAARARPLAPNCAPGQGRVDATNRALGASVEQHK